MSVCQMTYCYCNTSGRGLQAVNKKGIAARHQTAQNIGGNDNLFQPHCRGEHCSPVAACHGCGFSGSIWNAPLRQQPHVIFIAVGADFASACELPAGEQCLPLHRCHRKFATLLTHTTPAFIHFAQKLPMAFVILMNCKTGVDIPHPPCYNDDVETDMSACQFTR